MTSPATDVAAEQERRRRRPARRILAGGAAVSLVGAVIVGALGTSGAGSLAAAFIGGALTAGAAGLTTLVGAVRDELRGEAVPRGRMFLGIGLLLAAPVLLILAAGAASGA